jgi:pilus assembly protein Flp/PilA
MIELRTLWHTACHVSLLSCGQSDRTPILGKTILKETRMFTLKSLVSRAVKLVRRDEEGAALAEYGLLIALIAVFCIGAVTALGTAISDYLTTAAGSF